MKETSKAVLQRESKKVFFEHEYILKFDIEQKLKKRKLKYEDVLVKYFELVKSYKLLEKRLLLT